MIVQLRMDERLIHGQVVTTWSKYLDITGIVVANDEAASDELAKQMLLLAGSSTGKKVTIRSVEGAVELLRDPRAKNMKILLIAGSPKDTVKLVKALDIQNVNVANYVKTKSSDSIQLTISCWANGEEFQQFEELCEITPNVVAQLMPTEGPLNFKELMRKKKNENKGG